MRALDTNVLVRFLVRDDEPPVGRVRKLFERAERSGERFLVTNPVLLELLWVLSAVYELTRSEVLEAVDLLTRLPLLQFEDHDLARQLVRLGRTGRADLPDLLIGLTAASAGCEATLTLDKGLTGSDLFERL